MDWRYRQVFPQESSADERKQSTNKQCIAFFSLHLFGSFETKHDDEPIRFPTRKIEVLLAYLALHRGAPRNRVSNLRSDYILIPQTPRRGRICAPSCIVCAPQCLT